jgi:hypothetical protein
MAVVKKKDAKATAKTEAKVDWRTPEFAEIVLDAVAGGMSLKEVCDTNDLPKTTRITIDGKSLYVHRANFQIFDTDML